MSFHTLKFFLVLYCLTLQIPSYSSELEKRLSSFDIGVQPRKADWQFFMSAAPAWQEGLWQYYKTRNQRLRAWAWGWRLAWVKACAKLESSCCQEILSDGVLDQALVVRAEAAKTIGRRFKKSQNKEALRLLASAYRNKANLRHGRPLYVQRYILYAIRQIGGELGLDQGLQLASSHPETKRYWEKLTSLP